MFLEICAERYPSSSKVVAIVDKYLPGLTPYGKMVIISKFRDAIRQVAGSIYRSLEHRGEVELAIIEALEDLEDTIEGMLEERENQAHH
jgi:type III secretion protein W